METPKIKMKHKDEKGTSPLQNLHLNQLQLHKSPTKKCSNRPTPKKGFEELEEDMKNSHGLCNSDCTERSTPAGKMPGFTSFDFCNNLTHDSVSKTPPVEASVSPEIQFGSHAKMVGNLKSSATPLCYGAGHLSRKCRRRGSLRASANLIDDPQNVISNSQDPSIPLLVEASVRWLTEIKQEEAELLHGNASLLSDLMNSPLTVCGNTSDLACENSNCSGSGSLLDDSANRIDVLPPQKHFEFRGFSPHSNEKIESLLADNSNSSSSCGTVSFGDGKYVRRNMIESSSAFSLGSLSSENIIQTPNSGSSSYGNVGWFKKDTRHENVVQFEIDSIAETLNAVSISPINETSGLISSGDSIIPIRIQENVDSVCSLVSDSTLDLESLAFSQAKISWRDGLVSKVDEFDCTTCLSEGEEENDPGVKSCLRPCLGIEFRENEDNVANMNLDASPIVLEYEPCISVRGKEKLCEDGRNACAESISTNGGDLAASCDSDCT